jgi:hypothetical protein
MNTTVQTVQPSGCSKRWERADRGRVAHAEKSPAYDRPMDEQELWVESYQGEVLGEALFGALAAREDDPDRQAKLLTLTRLERSTTDLAEPVFERHAWDRGDTAKTTADAAALAEAVAATTWQEFLASFGPITTQYLGTYRQLVELAGDDEDRRIAEAYVAHELALAAFARRELGEEDGDPVEQILALPHVTAALG